MAAGSRSRTSTSTIDATILSATGSSRMMKLSRRTPTADLHKRAGSGARPFEGANISTSEKHAGAMYEFMREFAALEPQPPELQQLFRTVHGNQAAMDGFGEYRSDF